MPTDFVRIEIDSKELVSAPDGVAFIRERAVKEIKLTKQYDEEEMAFVEKDEDGVLAESCRKSYLGVRDSASSREQREARLQDKEKPVTHAPYRWNVKVAYSKPGTRGMWNRLRAE